MYKLSDTLPPKQWVADTVSNHTIIYIPTVELSVSFLLLTDRGAQILPTSRNVYSGSHTSK